MTGQTAVLTPGAISLAQSSVKHFLLIETGPRLGDIVAVDSPVLYLGRDPTCDLVISDDQISRHHARLNREGDELLLTDKASHNGTYVNGARIAGPTALHSGDRVRIGQSRLLVRSVQPNASPSGSFQITACSDVPPTNLAASQPPYGWETSAAPPAAPAVSAFFGPRSVVQTEAPRWWTDDSLLPGRAVKLADGGPPQALRADVPRRLAAVALDGVKLLVANLVALRLLLALRLALSSRLGSDWGDISLVLGLLLLLAANVAYWVLPVSAWGGTPGQRSLGLRVIDARGASPTLPRALLRGVAALLLANPLVMGFSLWFTLSVGRRALHDQLTGTWVVNARAYDAAAEVAAASERNAPRA